VGDLWWGELCEAQGGAEGRGREECVGGVRDAGGRRGEGRVQGEMRR